MNLYIIGAGPGCESLLTEEAKTLIKSAGLVVTTKRLFGNLSHLNPRMISGKYEELESLVRESKEENICILVSGDTGFFSAAKTYIKTFPEARLICGLSSLQYFCARLKTGWDDVKLISLHGRSAQVVPHVCYNRRVFLLAEPQPVINELNEAGLGFVKVSVGEMLSAPSERIVTDSAENLRGAEFSPLSVMLIENNSFNSPYGRIEDGAFIRGNVPMTKKEIRSLSLAALDIKPTDIIADIGAGTGAISAEAARSAHEGMVYSLEKEAEAVSLIQQNRRKFGAYNIDVRHRAAPDGITELPPPTKAFIGGSGGKLREILTTLIRHSPRIRIVVNAVTLETVEKSLAIFKEAEYDTDIICANISKAEKTGNSHMMKALNPVYIITGQSK